MKPAELLPLKRPPNADVVEELEELLADAKAGNVTGLVALIQYQGSETSFFSAGHFNIGEVLLAFEGWKHAYLSRELGIVE